MRKDLLLTISYGGIIYTPGSAGTMQEIFQDAVQNHYLTLGMSSPMVFYDTKFWTETMPAYSMLKQLSDTGRYKNLLLSITNSPRRSNRHHHLIPAKPLTTFLTEEQKKFI